ncbi:nucleoside hydrolase [Algiphilus sp.]|uniref:nucleoside hydrolase n=1 Tax=Algiphilus sp. TaxID=1872431 RepID=UPI0025C66A73|nr:nucleoside hydrolase [Algiphilus sp.]MCK5768741.1 nucleoside hydrolase [Algiphilus sp.]
MQARQRFTPRPARRWLPAAAMMLCACAPGWADGRKVILDDDFTGFSNVSPFLLLQSDDVDVLGFTVVSGVAWHDQNVAHALRKLEIAGRTDIPVVPGAVHPLLNSKAATERWETLHGELVFKGAWEDEPPLGAVEGYDGLSDPDVVPPLLEGQPATEPADDIAAAFLVRMVNRHPGEVTIIANGPLTNLAIAQSLDPDFAAKAKELVYMGGSLNPQQRRDTEAAAQSAHEYANTPRLEFNFRWDPEAASIVFRAPWRKITMVPVDPSTETEFRPDLIEELTRADTALTDAVERFVVPGLPMWDELSIAVWLDPTLIEVSEPLYIDVDTSFTAGYGNTLSWTEDHRPGLGEREQTVVRDIRLEPFERMLVERINRSLDR